VPFACGTVGNQFCVRFWKLTISLTSVRTGQSHRTLVGHTAPVTCVQFDELHIVSGSLDKTIRVGSLDWTFEAMAHDF
jgi:division protein 1